VKWLCTQTAELPMS